jgi:tRNA-2-methylthio-N6-dimethylallyladenosine synthase
MKELIPGLALSTDIITGFCSETDEEHADTVSLMELVKYDLAYMFVYSERERTFAHRKMEDDIPHDIKIKRLNEIVDAQHAGAKENNLKEIGKRHLVLVEGPSKRDKNQFQGRTDTNKMVIFDNIDFEKGDYVEVEITGATSATLQAKTIKKSSITEFTTTLVTA